MHWLSFIAGKTALVVKKVSIDESSSDCQVEIVARKSGLVSWLMSLVGIDSTFTFRVFRDRLEAEEGNLSGRINTIIPLSALDTFTYGFMKPIICLVLAVVLFIMALVMFSDSAALGFIFLIVAAVMGVLYYLRKSLILLFSTNGANGINFIFKRSLIEGVNVDENLSKRVYDIVKANYCAQTSV